MSDSISALRALAAKPSLEQLKKQARELQRDVRTGGSDALARALQSHPRFADPARFDPAAFSLSDAQLVIARELGFVSWPKLKTHVDRLAAAAGVLAAAQANTPSLPLLPLRDAVLFPQARLVLEVGRARSLAALREAAAGDQRVFCVAQRHPAQDTPDRAQLHDVGTIARAEVVKSSSGVGVKLLVRGLGRARLTQWPSAGDPLRAQLTPLAEPVLADAERLVGVLRLHAALERFARATDLLSLPEIERLAHEQNLAGLIGLAAGCCDLSFRQAWLELDDCAVVSAQCCAALDSLAAQARRAAPMTAADSHPSTAAAVNAPAEAQLTVLFSNAYPHLRGRRFALRSPRTSLGRDAAADVVLPSDAVSRHHAAIERAQDGGFELIDAGSTNGTFVAGQSDPITRHRLVDGDRFTLGDCILCFLQAPELEAKYQAALDRMTERDALTYLLNRNAFRTRLDRAVLHARGHDEPLSLLIADIDNLRQHNESLGELAANGLLMHVAQTLNGQLTGAAILGRYAGDQFAAALPQTSAPGAAAQAERLRAALEGNQLTVAGQRVQVTVSVGSATLQRTACADELIEDALAALRQAKHAGRNTVRGPLQAP